MTSNTEDTFAREAEEEIITRETSNHNHNQKVRARIRIDENSLLTSRDDENETEPLLDSPKNRKPFERGYSYERAINEPWTGDYRAGPLPWYKKPSIYWLLPAFLPFCIAFGSVLIPRTYLIQDIICRDLYRDRQLLDPDFHYEPIVPGSGMNDMCGQDNEVQAKTAIFNLYANLLAGIFSAIVAPHFGALSDRVGRRKVIVGATSGALVSELITIAVGRSTTLPVYWMLLGSLADGLTGSFTTGMALCFAYASDCTAPERRNVAFGHFHAGLFAGIAVGPIFGGLLIKLTDNIMVPFYFALGCHLFFMSFTALIVPESLSKERQVIAREKWDEEISKVGYRKWMITQLNIFKPLNVLWPQGAGSSFKLRKNLLLLATIDTMLFGIAMGTSQIILIYARKRFHFTAVDSSAYLSSVNIVRVSALLFVLPLLTRYFRGPASASKESKGHKGSDKLDIGIIRVAVLLDLIGYFGYGIAPSAGFLIAAGMLASLGGIGSPTLSSSMTKHVPSDRTGQLLGANGLLHAVARVVAPVIFNLIYAKTVAIYPGIVFYCLASLFVVVFALTWGLKPHIFWDDGRGEEQEDETRAGETLSGL